MCGLNALLGRRCTRVKSSLPQLLGVGLARDNHIPIIQDASYMPGIREAGYWMVP